ncbi:hypothetical protein NDU88_009608 [Pleurodeles waltl]|uniref:Uncharacterized protein n=1 Tax=Pleurodeles waltl TaxID=8319 RepID=A0AAV7RVQ0_PLEWA|nr:hypothetical protein NDU88_009608 [Pleurodeles waltl]
MQEEEEGPEGVCSVSIARRGPRPNSDPPASPHPNNSTRPEKRAAAGSATSDKGRGFPRCLAGRRCGFPCGPAGRRGGGPQRNSSPPEAPGLGGKRWKKRQIKKGA